MATKLKESAVPAKRIRVGDMVVVNFMNAQITFLHAATVVKMPTRGVAGDVWIFRDTDKGLLHYVNEPCTISQLNT